ncbi:hypothetical protein KC19_2G129600 [Ceratodon purpureus]|uniref:Uncharacterized protein n=1 Tax=Ceratodon purpureus TaxID=3225 RepID=A0A8T0IX65_CERPU|nr:hypothetical protein KC19_2G129600 [Ceratodon purpureus]
MDVVNGEIVSASTEWSIAEAWSALQPSLGRTMESSMSGSFDYLLAGNGSDWNVASPASFCSIERPFSAWGGCGVAPGHDPRPNSLALEPRAARWPSSRPLVEKHHHVGAFREFGGMQPRPNVEHHRQGWGTGVKRHFHFSPKLPLLQPDSATDLDQMLEMYESQTTQLVPGRLTSCASASSALGQADQSPTLPSSVGNSRELSLQRSGSLQEREAQSYPNSTLVSFVKRKRMRTSFSDKADVQLDCSWSHPLNLLLQKGLSSTDVGDLGRIIIPKASYMSREFGQEWETSNVSWGFGSNFMQCLLCHCKNDEL